MRVRVGLVLLLILLSVLLVTSNVKADTGIRSRGSCVDVV